HLVISVSVIFSRLFFHCSRVHRDLHSFPTRRSSDLSSPGWMPLLTGSTGSVFAIRYILIGGVFRIDDEPARATAIGGAARSLRRDRKSTRLNSSHVKISYAVFCLKKKTTTHQVQART